MAKADTDKVSGFVMWCLAQELHLGPVVLCLADIQGDTFRKKFGYLVTVKEYEYSYFGYGNGTVILFLKSKSLSFQIFIEICINDIMSGI